MPRTVTIMIAVLVIYGLIAMGMVTLFLLMRWLVP